MYRSYYLHWSRDSVSPVCGIFILQMLSKVDKTICSLVNGSKIWNLIRKRFWKIKQSNEQALATFQLVNSKKLNHKIPLNCYKLIEALHILESQGLWDGGFKELWNTVMTYNFVVIKNSSVFCPHISRPLTDGYFSRWEMQTMGD